MTTAHRPTWAPAKGHEEQGGARMFGPSAKHSKLDDNAHMTLKTRSVGQMTIKELIARDFKAELEAKEAKHFKRAPPGAIGNGIDGGVLQIADGKGETDPGSRVGPGGALAKETGPSRATLFAPTHEDRDDSDDDENDSDEDDDSVSDEDDTAALLLELDRIKKERVAESARREAETQEAEAIEKATELASGNPLLDLGGVGGSISGGGGGGVSGRTGNDPESSNFVVKRRWDDDVVFKNQTKHEPKTAKRFVNDTIRSDFHRRFLNKYIK